MTVLFRESFKIGNWRYHWWSCQQRRDRWATYIPTWLSWGEASWGSLLIMSTYPILNANHTHRNVPSRLQRSKLIFVQCRVPSEKCPSPFSSYPSFSSRYTSSLSSFKMLFNSPRPTRGFLPEFVLFLVLIHIFLISWLLPNLQSHWEPSISASARLN